MGYCGLDRRRQPLVGDEIRACWEAGPLAVADPPDAAVVAPSVRADDGLPLTRRRDFIEIVSGTAAADLEVTVGSATDSPAPPAPAGEPRWSLWTDLEA